MQCVQIHRHVAPPHSYIAADAFNSTVSLVEYLQYLQRNTTAYAKYFHWRRTHIIRPGHLQSALCHLCDNLNAPPPTDHGGEGDMYNWWKRTVCKGQYGKWLLSDRTTSPVWNR